MHPTNATGSDLPSISNFFAIVSFLQYYSGVHSPTHPEEPRVWTHRYSICCSLTASLYADGKDSGEGRHNQDNRVNHSSQNLILILRKFFRDTAL